MSAGWRKPLISVAIAAHICAIGLQNLPSHKSLWAIHKWYIGLTGQFQGWIMFANLSPQSNRIELVSRASDGATTEPYGPSKSWPVALLDVMMDATKSEAVAAPVLEALHARSEASAQASGLTLRILHKTLEPPGTTPSHASDFVVAKEFSRRW
jgi:hypothetical protein